MVELSSVANAPLKVIFLIHFILTSWGVQGHWSPSSYVFYNLVFFAILLWSIHYKDSEDPIQLALVVSVCSIVLDAIVLCIYFPDTYISSERFSVGMAILNLVVRPVTSLVLYRIYSDRSDSLGNGFGGILGGSNTHNQHSSYEDIDNMIHQSVPPTEVSGPTLFK